ncbi:MAG: arsenate reductase ArsC [Lentisphaerae bacterium]|nr:arsenate reductase ArsC [Lentisphaerota bacterium]
MIKLLFLCTGNSCRSQMAEGWTRMLKSDKIEAYSAGIEKHGLNLYAVKVMAEAGVDISTQKSKLIQELPDLNFDYVITVCGNAHKSCPFFPAASRVIHVGFDDPPHLAASCRTDEEKLDCYRRVRDEIRLFVESLPDNLAKLSH